MTLSGLKLIPKRSALGDKILTTYQKAVEVPRHHTHNSNCDHCRLQRQLAGLSRKSTGICWLNVELGQLGISSR
ncbi:MAG: hypothetical protein ACJ0SM_01020 [Arenicellales bacterium]